MNSPTLAQVLEKETKTGVLFESMPDGRLRCFACGHRCPIPEGKPGVCKVRFNKGGKLFVPWGYVGALQDDPIEKKPFFHALPGARALSFGMLGCDFHCANCQNWVTSQALRDPEADSPPIKISPRELVDMAVKRGCRAVVSTYNEPLITSEWAVEIFKEAKKEGLVTGYVSNGNGTPEVLDYIRPWVDLYKVDLKGFDDKHYRELGGSLDNVCRTIRDLYDRKFWLEIVTLLIPGFNDSDDELTRLTEFIVSVSPGIPWHVTAFHKDYKMTDPENTTAKDLLRAAAIGKKAGLHYIYPGNLPGQVGGGENTICPNCHERLIKRTGFQVIEDRISNREGRCPKCSAQIPGFWKPLINKKPSHAGVQPLF
ncbi:MAG: AmmeMemoRadiSam system radical SAM enzyme [Omnitrophica bacterium GWA2_52_8]|nr:MAG: AmmeMemoRadiSam system radical SAM enzyme [Omnitrophica bacterium GWA2_52_8]